MEVTNYIKPELLVLAPVLYLIGVGMKQSKRVDDGLIPALLGICGVILAALYLGAVCVPCGITDVLQMIFTGVTQGVLCAGLGVYVNQVYRQYKKSRITEEGKKDGKGDESAV